MVAQFVPRVLPLHSGHRSAPRSRTEPWKKRAHVEAPKIVVLLMATRGATDFHVIIPNFTHENNFEACTAN